MFSQINVDNQWKNAINPIFQNLDKSKISSGMLLDYAMEFTDVSAYNGVITDTTYVNANVVGDIYKTLFMSKVVADTAHTPLFDKYAYNWSRERFNATKDSSGVYILTGLLYEYQKFNENALAQNKIRVINNKYYDKYNNGTWQNPYETHKTFALTPPILHSRSKDVYFKLPNELFLTNLGSQINTIQLDADNGLGYQNLPFDTAVPFKFYQNKLHDLTFKINLSNGQTFYCRSKFKIDDPSLNPEFVEIPYSTAKSTENQNRIYIYEGNNIFSGAWITIRRTPNNETNNRITRPLIIAEGLDTGNFTAPEDFGGENTLNGLLDDLDFAGGQLRTLIDAGDFNHDYDLIYIDWARGMADLRDNSLVLEEVIKWVNANKTATAEPNVLLGQSMGGVIGRYTLARMENAQSNDPNAPDHDVRLFIAHDSPMQGANTPLGLSHFSAHMKQEYVSTPLTFLSGEVLLPVGLGLAQLGEAFLNIFGNNDNIPAYVSPAQLLSLQDQTASRQLNYWSVDYTGLGGEHGQTRDYNLSWQQTLDNEGWPQQSRNIAISNGNECGADNGFAAGDPLLTIDSRSNPGFLLDAMNMLVAPLTGIATLDPGLFIIGTIPGSSRWQTNFDINTYGNLGSQNEIYRGRIRYEKKVLWIGPRITVNVTNQSYDAPSQALPFDTYSGGTIGFVNSQGGFNQDIPIIEDLINVINESTGFIPVVSALDIKKTNGNAPTPNDYLKSYAGGMPADPNLESGFDAFIVDNLPDQPTNNDHLSFQPRNGNWLADELEAESPADYPIVENCSYICNTPRLAIFGPESICGISEDFSVNVPNNATVTWSTDITEAISISSSGSFASVSRVDNYKGSIKLIATVVLNGDCGPTEELVYEKNIILGEPEMYPQGLSSPGFPTNPFSFCQTYEWKESNWIYLFAFGAQPTSSYQFEQLTYNFQYSLQGNILKLIPSNTGTLSFRVRTQNNCGWSDWKTHTYQVTSCTGGGLFYVAYPNPTSNSISVNVNTTSKKSSTYNSTNKYKSKDEHLDIEIYDNSGHLQKKLNKKLGEPIDVTNLKSGVYVLRIISKDKDETHQVVLN